MTVGLSVKLAVHVKVFVLTFEYFGFHFQAFADIDGCFIVFVELIAEQFDDNRLVVA